MTEQELIQENTKLQARLQKAVEVFKEQKADIQRLTEEKSVCVSENERLQKRINELEKLAEDKNEKDDQFFEQVQEIENLKSTIETINGELKNTKDNVRLFVKDLSDFVSKFDSQYIATK